MASAQRTIVLVGIADEMRRAIERLATERGFSVSCSRDRQIHGAALCVFAVEPRAPVSNNTAHALAGAPCVAVLEHPDPHLASALFERGASDVVVGNDAGLAERCLRWARMDGAGSEPTSALIGSRPRRVLDRRDLEAVIESIPITGHIPTASYLPPAPGPGRPRPAPAARKTIASVLLETDGNVSRAARRLSVPRSTLRYWIEQLDLQALIPAD